MRSVLSDYANCLEDGEMHFGEVVAVPSQLVFDAYNDLG
jgi:hypothetical protein